VIRAAASLAMIALLAACNGADKPEPQSALRFSPDIAEDFPALPRMTGDASQAREINAALDRVDADHRSFRADCLTMKPRNDNVFWSRSVEAPMTGPRFVSILISQGDYCGGAHPSWGRTPLAFDLETGRLIDWKAWLPADMAAPILDEEADKRMQPAVLTSPTLKAWFAERALAGMDSWGRKQCADVYGDAGLAGWNLVAWPDAKAGGLRLQTSGLAHAAMGCHMDVLMPLSDLRRRGVRREFTDALQAAHRAGLWRDAPPEREAAR
jgi:hypothetical protein